MQKSSLFVGDLSIFCSENDLVDTFQQYGPVLEVKIMRCEETLKNLSYGFIKYETQESATKAMNELNGKLLCGRPMRISWASHRIGRSSLESNSSDHSEVIFDSASIHVIYTANQIKELITEEELRNVFNTYGNVIDLTIKKFELDEVLKVQRGYGFVHFPPTLDGIKAAFACSDSLRDVAINNIIYKCEISHKLIKQLHTIKDPEILKFFESRPIPELTEEMMEETKSYSAYKYAKPKPSKPPSVIGSTPTFDYNIPNSASPYNGEWKYPYVFPPPPPIPTQNNMVNYENIGYLALPPPLYHNGEMVYPTTYGMVSVDASAHVTADSDGSGETTVPYFHQVDLPKNQPMNIHPQPPCVYPYFVNGTAYFPPMSASPPGSTMRSTNPSYPFPAYLSGRPSPQPLPPRPYIDYSASAYPHTSIPPFMYPIMVNPRNFAPPNGKNTPGM